MSFNIQDIKYKNLEDREKLKKIIESINTIERQMEKKLHNLVEHINFINELYNQSLDLYHNIVVNLIEVNSVENDKTQ